MIRNIKNLYQLAGRNKATLAINILGLSIGLATTILLATFILHEWSYDRHFSKADNIYRLHTIYIDAGKESVEPINLRQTYTEIPQNVPGIETAVQIYRGWNTEIISDNIRYAHNNLLYVDSTFFTVFDFNIIEGAAEHALNDPGSVVLTRSLAYKIFGDIQSVGKILEIENNSYMVSAVMDDVPENTHFSFDLLLPMNAMDYLHQLGGLEFFTYFLFDPYTDPLPVGNAICEANTEILTKRFSMFGNLFIIEGEQRTKEIGIRKVLGGSTSKMLGILYSGFLKWIAIASVTAIPVSYYLLDRWLQNYAIQAPLNWWLFVQGLFIVIFLQTVVTIWQTLRVARRNPVKSLRYE